VIWFNPPYDKRIATDVARRFLALINTHFSKDRELRKLFNRSNVKVSYSCMPNMASIIKSHNTRILAPPPPAPSKLCNCQRPGPNFQNCPLKGKCVTESVIYRAHITAPNAPLRHYTGLAGSAPKPGGAFKSRYYGHVDSIKPNHPDPDKARKETELSKHVWQLRDQGKPEAISWEILQKCVPYQCGSRRCDVCLSEKLHIILADPATSLNKRSELVSTCRHQKQFRHNNKALKADAT
jgi:hypothetical protein